MTDEQNTPPPSPSSHNDIPPPELVTDHDLEQLLLRLQELMTAGPDQAQIMLMRQSEILDKIFNALVAANLSEAVHGQFQGKTSKEATTGWLQLALQTQKQSQESLKTASAIGYMDNIMQKRLTPPPAK